MPFIPGEEKLTPGFRQKVGEVAGRLGTAPEDLLGVMSFETGGSFSTGIKNRAGSGATGLIQFMPSTAQSLGTSPEALAQMSPEQQLDVVEKYLTPYKGKLNSLKDTYMAVLYPAAIGAPESTTLFQQGSKAYEQNAGLDVRQRGQITVGDVLSRVRRFLGGGVAEAATHSVDDEIDREIARVKLQQEDDIKQRYINAKNAQIDSEFGTALNQLKTQQGQQAGMPEAPVRPPESLWERVGRDAAQVGGGIRDAFVSTMQSLNLAGDWMREHGIGPSGKINITIPEFEKAGTVEGDLIRGASQFLTAFLPAARAVKAVGIAGELTSGLASGAIADFLAFDPTKPRMSNLLEQLPAPLKNPVTEYLAARPEDTGAEGRLKNVIEGLGLGALTGGLISAFKTMRSARTLSQEVGQTATDTFMAKETAAIGQTGKVAGVRTATPGVAQAADEPVLRMVTDEEISQMLGSSKASVLPKSVVRNESGDIQRVYHGTQEAFMQHDVSKARPSGKYGKGIYFTEDPAFASGAAQQARTLEEQAAGGATGANVRPAYLDLQRPFEATPATQWSREDLDTLLRKGGDEAAADALTATGSLRDTFPGQEAFDALQGAIKKAHNVPASELGDATQRVLKEAGYDGIAYMESPHRGVTAKAYVAFSPEQVHSAFGVEALQATPTTVRLTDETASRLASSKDLPPSLSIGPTQREQAQQFQSMAASGATEALPTSGRVLHVNFDRIQTGDDLKQTIGAISEIMKAETETQRRGVQSTSETVARAASSEFQEVDRILGIGPGSAMNAEDATAVRQVWIASADRLQALSRELAQGNLAVSDEWLKQFVITANVHTKAMGVQAEAGRALRAFGIDMPSTDKQFLEQLGDAIAGASTPEAQELFRSVGAAGASQNAMNLAQQIAGLAGPQQYAAASMMLQQLYSPEQLARLSQQQHMAAMVAALTSPEQLAKFMRDVERVPAADMFTELWYGSLLSSPPTHVANSLDGALRTAWAIPEHYFATFTGHPRDMAKNFQAANAYVYGLKEGLQEAWRYAADAFKTGISQFGESGKVPFAREPAVTARGAGLDEGSLLGGFVDFLGSAARLSGRGLMAADEFFKTINYRMQLHESAFRQATDEGLSGSALAQRIVALVDNPTPELKTSASAWANYQTLSQPLSQQGGAFENLGNFVEHLTKGREDWLPAKIVLPFIKTPFNIVRYGLERTPILGNLSANVNQRLMAGGAEGALARSQMALGTMTMAMFGLMAMEGGITGKAPEDPGQRQTWERLGIQPYSIWVPALNKYVSYNRLDLIGLPMGLAADFVQIAKESSIQSLEHITGAMLGAVFNSVTSKTWLKGVADVVDAITPGRGDSDKQSGTDFERYLRQLVGSVVPSGIATVARMLDPVQRETRSLVDAVLARVPGMSDQLPPRLDIWGRERLRPEPLGPDLVSPFMSRDYTPDEVDNELYRLGVPLRMPDRAISIPRSDRLAGETVELTPQQYDRYVKLSAGMGEGQKPLKEALRDLMHSAAYEGELTDGPRGGRSWLIQDMVQRYRQMGMMQLRKEDESIERLLEQKAISRELLKTQTGTQALQGMNFQVGAPR